jgi:DNA polymerase I-like protein with 3'-5' exonuclease and polymerase domains
MQLIIDIESDALMELTLDSKGNPNKECSKVHCVVTKDIATNIVHVWHGSDLGKPFLDYLSKATMLIGHNLYGFDLECLRRMLGYNGNAEIYDSLIVSKLMYPDLQNHPLGGNSLSDWGKYLGNEKINYTGTWSELTLEMIDYCIQDVHVAHDIYKKQQEWLASKPEYSKVVKLEHLATEIINQQQVNGFNFDLPAGEQLMHELLHTKAQIEDEMRVIFPDKVHVRFSDKTGKRLKDKVEVFNPGSRKQIAERLYEKYGWTAPETEAGNPNVDSSVLGELDYPEAKKLVEYFDIIKLMGQVEDWTVRATNSRDGKVHGFVNVQGAATGRCTHSQPNLAQVSGDHRARALWVPHAGDVLLGSDLSGLELRMLAHYMHDYDGGAYADVILNADIHLHNQEKAGLPTRNNAKTFIYGFLYGAGDAKIGKIVNGSSKQGAALKEKFLRELPALAKVKQWVEFQVAKSGTISLVDGRKAPVRSKHAALNTLLQGSGAVVSKYWMILACRNLTKRYGANKVKQVAYVHDELQFSCPPDIADEAGRIITDSAIEAGKRLGIKMPINAEFKVGRNWSETH